MSNFGARLREARKAKGLTLDQLGAAIGSSKAYVWQLENKEVASPTGDLLMKLCSTLDKEPSFFIGSENKAADELAAKEILFRKFQSLTESDQKNIISFMEAMKKNEENT